MWIYDTGEQAAIHIPDIAKETVLDAFIYPLKAICGYGKRNGYIRNEVNGGTVETTEFNAKRSHGKRGQYSASAKSRSA